MREVLHSPYFVVTVDDHEGIVRVVRTTLPFATVAEVTRGWLDVVAALDRAGRKGRSLLADLRLGPARNEPDFEQAVRAIVPRVHAGFVRNAVLVRMAVGALQIRRHAKSDGIDRFVTDSEDEAIAYMRDGHSSAKSQR
jgi:hypothetical protein